MRTAPAARPEPVEGCFSTAFFNLDSRSGLVLRRAQDERDLVSFFNKHDDLYTLNYYIIKKPT